MKIKIKSNKQIPQLEYSTCLMNKENDTQFISSTQRVVRSRLKYVIGGRQAYVGLIRTGRIREDLPLLLSLLVQLLRTTTTTTTNTLYLSTQ